MALDMTQPEATPTPNPSPADWRRNSSCPDADADANLKSPAWPVLCPLAAVSKNPERGDGLLVSGLGACDRDAALPLVALLLFTGLAALTRWGIGHLSDRVGPARMLWLLVLACVAGLALVAWAVAAPGRAVGIVLGMALVGIAYGALQNLTMGLAFASVRRTDQIVASAAWNIGFDAGTGIGAVAVGALATGYGFPTALVAAAVVSALTLPIAIFSARRPARR